MMSPCTGRLAREHWGLGGESKSLDGERDQNRDGAT